MNVIKINKFIFLLFLKCYLIKEIENIFSVFLWSYRNTCGSLGETRNCVETLTLRARVATQFLVSPKLPRVFL